MTTLWGMELSFTDNESVNWYNVCGGQFWNFYVYIYKVYTPWATNSISRNITYIYVHRENKNT